MKCATALVAMHLSAVDGWRPESTTYVDHETMPFRCHMVDEAHADLCALALETMAVSWRVQVDELGFAEPILDDDDRFDLYITSEFTGGGAYVAGEGGDGDPDDGRMGQQSYMALDPTIPLDEFPSYVAHEFNHVVQYSTDFIEPTLPAWEATATAAEAWTIDDHQIWGEWVADFQSNAWMGVLGDGYRLWDDFGIWSYHEYGAGIWILHLDHTHFDGTGTGGAALWWAMAQDSIINEPDVLDAWAAVTGGPWTDALEELVAFNLVSHDPARRPAWVDDRDDGEWGSVPMETLSGSDLPATVIPEWGVAPTGWVHLELSDTPEDVVVSLAGADGLKVALVAVDTDGTVQTDRTWPVRLELTGDVDLAVVNLGPPELDGDDPIELFPLEITLAVEPVVDPEDTGDPNTDDTDEPSDNDEPLIDGSPSDASDDEADKGGCSATGTAAGWTLLAGLMGVARRRAGTTAPER